MQNGRWPRGIRRLADRGRALSSYRKGKRGSMLANGRLHGRSELRLPDPRPLAKLLHASYIDFISLGDGQQIARVLRTPRSPDCSVWYVLSMGRVSKRPLLYARWPAGGTIPSGMRVRRGKTPRSPGCRSPPGGGREPRA